MIDTCPLGRENCEFCGTGTYDMDRAQYDEPEDAYEDDEVYELTVEQKILDALERIEELLRNDRHPVTVINNPPMTYYPQPKVGDYRVETLAVKFNPTPSGGTLA